VRLAAVRDQLWAEAAVLFKRLGEVEWRPAYELANPERDNFMLEDVWQAAVERWLSTGEEEVTQPLTLEGVFIGALGRAADRVSKVDRDRLADVLRAINYENKVVKICGKPARRWVPLT
jgi:predicted P-loop ATPase